MKPRALVACVVTTLELCTLSQRDLISLYKTADAYVSAHWGEGWGLPLADAMAMGIPTIATNFSGNTEFMTDANSFLVGYSLAPYKVDDEWFGGLSHAVANVHTEPKMLENQAGRGH